MAGASKTDSFHTPDTPGPQDFTDARAAVPVTRDDSAPLN